MRSIWGKRILFWGVLFIIFWTGRSTAMAVRKTDFLKEQKNPEEQNGLEGRNDLKGKNGLEDQNEPEEQDPEAVFDLEPIQKYLDGITSGDRTGLSFGELMEKIRAGELSSVISGAKEKLVAAFFGEIRTNGAFLSEILILSLCGAAFSGFFGIFDSGQLSETGFYVICLCVETFLAASFFASIRIAEETVQEILGFMKVLLPAYFLAVTMAGGAVTSASVCGFTLAATGVIGAIVSGFLLPVMKLYMVLSLVGNLVREEMFSVMTELIGKIIGWTVKTMFGIVVGFHLIQGLVLPQADAVKNAAVLKTIEAVPGIGSGVGAVGNLVLGSAVLIKNTAGAAAVAVLFFLAAVPVMKLFVLMVLYYAAASVMQPVCDKRLTACMVQTAVGHGLLLKIVGYSLALFAVTIAVIGYSTNALY